LTQVRSEREHDGWIVREWGPPDAAHAVLLLPGALGTAAFFDDLIAAAADSASIRFVATTLPGFGGTPPPDEPTVERYAEMAARLARDLRCTVVVGHSLGANVALEMAASGGFRGPLVLLSPSLSRRDESTLVGLLDRLGRVLGTRPYEATLRLVGPAMRWWLPAARRERLVAEMRRNDPGFLRRENRAYLEYLDRHGSLAPRLCEAGVDAWLVFGDRRDVGLAEDERALLARCPGIRIVRIAGAGHFTLNERPDRVAEVVVEAAGRDEDRSVGPPAGGYRQAVPSVPTSVPRSVPTLEIRVETPDAPEPARLLEALEREKAERYPEGHEPDSAPDASPDELSPPEGAFLVAYIDGRAAGCGGVRRMGREVGELKHLYVAPEARGSGLGRRLLGEMEEAARRIGYRTVRVETNPALGEAIRLYEAAGYRTTEPYDDNPYAKRYLEKDLFAAGYP
jgi:pimeloyl-ACP methyl ester carboxylesterase/GNAT superfamily N-acetyltransferase